MLANQITGKDPNHGGLDKVLCAIQIVLRKQYGFKSAKWLWISQVAVSQQKRLLPSQIAMSPQIALNQLNLCEEYVSMWASQKTGRQPNDLSQPNGQ